MLETFQSAAVLVVALLPGALYVWSFERQAGAWGIRLADRLFRSVGFSAVIHALFAPVTYALWDRFIRSGRLSSGEAPFALWLVPLVYVVLPVAAGWLIGWGTRSRKAWAKLFTGPDPAPRAWDHLFGSTPDGWIRLRLKSGIWLGGAFVRRQDGTVYAHPVERGRVSRLHRGVR